jgi:hypothetical protein
MARRVKAQGIVRGIRGPLPPISQKASMTHEMTMK